jgi:hypothetical protein
MPIYSFRNNDTNDEFEKTMSNSERELFLANNPNIVQIFTKFPGVVDPVRVGLRKPDDGFRDVLRNVKHHHKKDSINTF